jgi:hypothetical protein
MLRPSLLTSQQTLGRDYSAAADGFSLIDRFARYLSKSRFAKAI